MSSTSTLLVIRYKTLLMQRLADLVQRGYHRYTCGTIHVSKLSSLCEKFESLYFTADNSRRRHYKKSKGEGNAFLMFADLDKGDTLHWWLLVTEGTHPAHTREKLFDAEHRRQRLRVGDYELVQLTLDKERGGGARWTWRMTDTVFDEWRSAIIEVVRTERDNMELSKLVYSLYRAPGFGQIRVQVRKLIATLKGEWVRSGKAADDLILPPTLHYVRRLADETYTVADWLKEQKE